MDTTPLKGKVALVTGAGSGLGEATARAFAQAGCDVVCVDINGEAAERVRQSIAGQDTKCIALQCDVSNADAVF
ncbi:MAG TPA: SDR family NAD(P)-dependent oxidoreductase, partial [Ktedonobacteraceae bacterium]|nr:SDR family NAD(P)-dependent oxidoreductase [Ktedonobacteraceae bacterium]